MVPEGVERARILLADAGHDLKSAVWKVGQPPPVYSTEPTIQLPPGFRIWARTGIRSHRDFSRPSLACKMA